MSETTFSVKNSGVGRVRLEPRPMSQEQEVPRILNSFLGSSSTSPGCGDAILIAEIEWEDLRR
jgi:hypothetical protein